jgi:hypothetical protein
MLILLKNSQIERQSTAIRDDPEESKKSVFVVPPASSDPDSGPRCPHSKIGMLPRYSS